MVCGDAVALPEWRPRCLCTPTHAIYAVRQVKPLDDAGGGRKRKPDKRRKVREEGTTAGDGVRRLCYCARHDPLTAPRRAVLAMARTSGISSQSARHARVPPTAGTANVGKQPSTEDKPPTDGEHPLPTSLGHSAGCSRAVAYDHALRRGHREPNAVAAAAAKRHFMRQTLYLTGCSRSDPAERPQHRAVTPAETAAEAVGDSSRGAAGKRSPGSPGPPPVRTLAERYDHMRRSLGSRVTCGKSAIHGYGAFSKLPHAQGACSPAEPTHCSAMTSLHAACAESESTCTLLASSRGACRAGALSATPSEDASGYASRPTPASSVTRHLDLAIERRRHGDRVRRRGGPPQRRGPARAPRVRRPGRRRHLRLRHVGTVRAVHRRDAGARCISPWEVKIWPGSTYSLAPMTVIATDAVWLRRSCCAPEECPARACA